MAYSVQKQQPHGHNDCAGIYRLTCAGYQKSYEGQTGRQIRYETLDPLRKTQTSRQEKGKAIPVTGREGP
jgi:hypothetical protein